MIDKSMVHKVYDGIYEMKRHDAMNVPAWIIATDDMIDSLFRDKTLWQLKNVASLPGIVKRAILMPDGHEGYGFPIGGVAAFDANDGIISPGGIGYDINCGVRLVKTNVYANEFMDKMKALVNQIFSNVPSGVGSEGKLRLSHDDLDDVSLNGVRWAIENGFGWKEDVERIEENGSMPGADPNKVSLTAKKRGKRQLGTLGAGNHFLEIQVVSKIFDESTANAFGLFEGQLVFMIHTGSRGFGHQIASDYIDIFMRYAKKNNIRLPDPELVYAYVHSDEANDYIKAMKSAVNFAFTNRQIITHWLRESVSHILGPSVADEMHILYDVAHNIAKFESHVIDGEKRNLIVHRKGATRAFPRGRDELPSMYRSIGQPVLIPGSMGTASYDLVGNDRGLNVSFGSTCHGAGRTMSRRAAVKKHRGESVVRELLSKGIFVKPASMRVAAEEAPDAYKDIDAVVNAVQRAGISSVVAKLKPLGVVKG